MLSHQLQSLINLIIKFIYKIFMKSHKILSEEIILTRIVLETNLFLLAPKQD